jgi:hypothetical protein
MAFLFDALNLVFSFPHGAGVDVLGVFIFVGMLNHVRLNSPVGISCELECLAGDKERPRRRSAVGQIGDTSVVFRRAVASID